MTDCLLLGILVMTDFSTDHINNQTGWTWYLYLYLLLEYLIYIF